MELIKDIDTLAKEHVPAEEPVEESHPRYDMMAKALQLKEPAKKKSEKKKGIVATMKTAAKKHGWV